MIVPTPCVLLVYPAIQFSAANLERHILGLCSLYLCRRWIPPWQWAC